MNAREKNFTAENAEENLSFSALSAFSAVDVFLFFQGAACQ